MFPGTSSTTVVTFRSNQNLARVVVEATPSLDGILSVSPTSFPSITANQSYQVTFTLKAPSEFKKREFGGTIHIRNNGKPPKTYAKPLEVALRTDWNSYKAAGVSLSYPQDWYVLTDVDPDRVVLSSTPAPPASEGEAGADIELLVEANPNNLTVDTWVGNTFGVNMSTVGSVDIFHGLLTDGTAYLGLFGVVPSADPENVQIFISKAGKMFTLRGHRGVLPQLLMVLASLRIPS
jgi:hypothetical protein